MENFQTGHDEFKHSYFKKHEKELIELAKKGQQPKALFIGCADSRVVPNLVTQSKPGELFVLRNIGNFVPPYGLNECYNATASGIEYAVKVLKVTEIIICGHSHCGAIAHLYSHSDEKNPHIDKWLALGKSAKSMAIISQPKNIDKESLLRVTEKLSIISQLDNLLSYPCVRDLVEQDKLFLHGWYYDIENGDIDYFDPDDNIFKPLSDLE
jgi:carbonic anhydrase